MGLNADAQFAPRLPEIRPINAIKALKGFE